MAKLVGAGMMPALRSSQFIRFVWLGQAALYLATGIWPFVSMRSFQKVTGPKAEGWLVQTVGALVSVIGVVMGVAALRRRLLPELALLGMGAAGSLAGIDVT